MKGAHGRISRSGSGRMFRSLALPVLCCLAFVLQELLERGEAHEVRCVWTDDHPFEVLPCIGTLAPNEKFYVRCPRGAKVHSCLEPIETLDDDCPADMGPREIARRVPHLKLLPRVQDPEGEKDWPINVSTNTVAPADGAVTVYIVCTPQLGLSGWNVKVTFAGADYAKFGYLTPGATEEDRDPPIEPTSADATTLESTGPSANVGATPAESKDEPTIEPTSPDAATPIESTSPSANVGGTPIESKNEPMIEPLIEPTSEPTIESSPEAATPIEPTIPDAATPIEPTIPDVATPSKPTIPSATGGPTPTGTTPPATGGSTPTGTTPPAAGGTNPASGAASPSPNGGTTHVQSNSASAPSVLTSLLLVSFAWVAAAATI